MTRPARRWGLALVAVSALVLSSCASGGTAGSPATGGANTPGASPSPVSDADSPQPTPAASRMGRVSGQVLAPDGTPAPNCAVDKGGGTEEAVVTDASGRFELSQDPGEWTLRFACSTAADKDAIKVTVNADEVTRITVTLTAIR